MLIEELVPGVNLEDYRIEFKGILKEGPSKDGGERLEMGWLKEIVAFANTFGGTMYVGVNDKTHEVLSLGHKEADEVALMVQRLVKEHIEPPIRYTIEKLAVPNTSPTRYVLAIRVEKSKYPPISLRFHSAGIIYVRHFGKTSPATGEEIRNLVMSSESASFDMQETDIRFDPSSFTGLYRFYKEQNEGKDLTEKDLLNIGFMTPEGNLRRGALLFADSCQEERTLIECSKFKGASKGGSVFLASKSIKGNLLDELLEARAFVESNSVSSGFVKTPSGRSSLFSFPPRSLTEGLANAIGHRNYFMQGGQIEVNLFLDRLEIVSPGSLVTSKWLSHEKELSKIPPIRRNELICAVLSLCRLMDHKGSGFDKIVEEYGKYGDAFAPFADSDDVSFTLTLPDLTHSQGLIANLECPEVYTVEALDGKNSLRVLSYCYSAPRSAPEIASFLGIKPSSYFRKQVLEPLLEDGYLVETSSSFPAKYISNSEKVFPR